MCTELGKQPCGLIWNVNYRGDHVTTTLYDAIPLHTTQCAQICLRLALSALSMLGTSLDGNSIPQICEYSKYAYYVPLPMLGPSLDGHRIPGIHEYSDTGVHIHIMYLYLC